MSDEEYKTIKKRLDDVSPSFCLAKWLQVTIHLQNGYNHSCHHPPPHKVSVEEVKKNPKALHNSDFKKQFRKMMLKGQRPKECDYCWRIEDAAADNFSDRMHKSAANWALPDFDKVKDLPWDADINPTYLEVSFGNECNFKCAYCSPWVSSAILTEYQKFGPYRETEYYSLENLKALGQYPYSKHEENPYVEAFWEWWPTMSPDLKVFRITGGEPLLNKNTFQFLESILKDPKPNLEIAINTNLGIPDVFIDRFIQLSKQIIPGVHVKNFQLFTSLDTFGEQAEYVRFGLNYQQFYANLRKVMTEVKDIQLIFMTTFNIFSVPRFTRFLEDIKAIKKEFKNPYDNKSRIQLSMPYLRYPAFLGANILQPQHIVYVEQSMEYMLRNAIDDGLDIFEEWEIDQLRRILTWLQNEKLSEKTTRFLREQFVSYVDQYDERKNLSFAKTFPELKPFYDWVRTQKHETKADESSD
jgi:organic radical activating enzyme